MICINIVHFQFHKSIPAITIIRRIPESYLFSQRMRFINHFFLKAGKIMGGKLPYPFHEEYLAKLSLNMGTCSNLIQLYSPVKLHDDPEPLLVPGLWLRKSSKRKSPHRLLMREGCVCMVFHLDFLILFFLYPILS
jgi:hypothetical protein